MRKIGLMNPAGLALSVACFGLLALVACSTGNTASEQCSVRADCDALGLVGYTCNSGLCELETRVTPVDPDGGGSTVCNSDDECVTANAGRPSICPEPGVGKCVNLATDSCRVEGDFKNKNAIFIGETRANASANSQDSFISINGNLQWDLAWGQINNTLPGGGVPAGSVRRPVVRVICETAGIPELVNSSAVHLISNVHVSAVRAQRTVEAFALQAEAAKTRTSRR